MLTPPFQVGALDAQLFMIKHLLFLREHIAPFNVQFAVTDFDLDFSHMRDHMRNILGGQGSLFSMGNNAVMKMLGTGGPRVLTYQELGGLCIAVHLALVQVWPPSPSLKAWQRWQGDTWCRQGLLAKQALVKEMRMRRWVLPGSAQGREDSQVTGVTRALRGGPAARDAGRC
eukprot:1156421-Pelagomonas_calceolata.AAC.5